MFLSDAIRRRRPFTSGAKESDIDPVGHIQDELIPANPNHNFLKSEMRKRRQFSSGASDEYVELKTEITAYDQEVKDAIAKYRNEQPKNVGTLERLWNWLTTDIDDSSDDVQHRHRQLTLVQQLLTTIQQAHIESEKRKKESEKKRMQALAGEIGVLSSNIEMMKTTHYTILHGDDAWWQDYESFTSLFAIIKKDSKSQTEENLADLVRRLKTLQQDAQSLLGTSSTGAAVKIGLDPFDTTDANTIFDYYEQTGGIAPKGQVLTVCQKADKYGGTYTYQGKVYDMYHDSHGPKEGNSNESRTAWKILIGNKLQVVGIGHHIPGAAKYEAIFPFATDPALQEYGPSPNITDSRT
ncbi:MAG: hypothetical protein R2873_29980 [Caldilineaceae bacterium]